MYNRLLDEEEFSEDWTQSLIVFIPKPNGKGHSHCSFAFLRLWKELYTREPDGTQNPRFSSLQRNWLPLLSILCWYLSLMSPWPTIFKEHYIRLRGHRECIRQSHLDTRKGSSMPRFSDKNKKICKQSDIGATHHVCLWRRIQNTPYTIRKDTLQGFGLSLLLFNLRREMSAWSCTIFILQYADDIVSTDKNWSGKTVFQTSLDNIYKYLSDRNLNLSTAKLQ